jgi:Tol biopolymer transport system component
MKKYLAIVLIILATVAGCKEKKPIDRSAWADDKFAAQFKDLAQIAELKQITDMQKDLEPAFSESGDRIYFKRIVTPNPNDSTENAVSARAGQYSYDYLNNQLYLSEKTGPEFDQFTGVVPQDSLPSMLGEVTQAGFHTPYGLIFYTIGATFCIYKSQGDSITQLTYGSQPAFLQGVSPNGRYVAFNYGDNYFRLVVLDLATGEFYSLPRSSVDVQLFELWPRFSPDSKYLAFVVSHDIFNAQREGENLPLGDLWLAKFKSE